MYAEAEQIKQLVVAANKIVIIQADNPDADSLGTALALEHIIGDLGKEPYLYCSTDMPGYLRYLAGWDRVQNELPNHFDASIIVDASTLTLLERMISAGYRDKLASKPVIVLDHHQIVENLIDFSTVTVNDHNRSSAGELVYRLAQQLEWPLSNEAKTNIMSSILGDTQGLTNQLATVETYKVMTELIEAGVSRPTLEELRREYSKMAPEIYRYKGALIKRTEFAADGRIALVAIPQAEINEYSPLYNPAPLIQGDMLQTSGVEVAIVLKHYADGRVTGAIRSNLTAPISGQLAEQLGGGGHAYASGFKVTDGRPVDEIKATCLGFAIDLLNTVGS